MDSRSEGKRRNAAQVKFPFHQSLPHVTTWSGFLLYYAIWRYEMKYPVLLILFVLVMLVAIQISTFKGAQTTQGQALPLIVGTWKLNAEKSNVRLPPDSFEI